MRQLPCSVNLGNSYAVKQGHGSHQGPTWSIVLSRIRGMCRFCTFLQVLVSIKLAVDGPNICGRRWHSDLN